MKKITHLLKMSARVYRERGIISLVKRIFWYARELSVIIFFGSGDVLYISGCPGGSRAYRCYNQAEDLAQYGIRAKVISQGNLSLLWIVKKFTIIIFQRAICDEHVRNVIAELKKQKKTILFETDDLVFDPAYIPFMHYYQFMGREEQSWYDNGIGRELLEDSSVAHCVVSTHYLAEAIRKKYPAKHIFISRNKLGVRQQEDARRALAQKDFLRPSDGKIRIGYFSGSKSHDNDFETVSSVVLRILKENKNTVLMIVGHLKLSKIFDEVKDQVEYHSFVSLPKLPELILRCDINIVPLEIDNPFCQAKSALKFFEAGILEVPTIAAATDSFIRTVDHQKNGFLAGNAEEWYQYLTLLIGDADLREKIGKKAKEDSLQYHTVQRNNDSKDYIQFLLRETGGEEYAYGRADAEEV